MSNERTIESLGRQLAALEKFPDQNPNPVLKVSMEGVLTYANEAALRIHQAWGVSIGERVPDALIEHATAASSEPLEMA